VLTHGTPSRSVVWREVVPVLARTHAVYVWDLLGFGDSESEVEQEVSLIAHGEVLAELIDEWDLDGPALVGHDIGAAVVLRAHLIEGVHVSRLGLIDGVVLAPWITPRTREMQRSAHRWTHLPDAQLGETIAEHLRSATAKPLADDVFEALFGQWSGAHGQRLYLRNLAQFDEDHTRAFESLLSSISVPTAVIWGQQDGWLPVETAQRVAERIPNARCAVLPDAGHFCMEDDPGAVTDALLDLLGAQR
jgi:pimeloyl-ACP methyl ester carboxylesterase